MSHESDEAGSLSRAPSYKGRRPASSSASSAARGSSKKTDTRCEVLLRRELWRAGCRFRKNVGSLPGKPDIVFSRVKVVVFCDGDFWHGRSWQERSKKLETGANPDYWLGKIQRNRQRDHAHSEELTALGWTVLRVWEGEILADPGAVARRILEVLDTRGHRHLAATDEREIRG